MSSNNTYIYAQSNTNTAGVSQTVGDLINSIALSIVVVAPLVVSGLAYVKANSGYPGADKANCSNDPW
jgi:hypothetical protein